MAKQKCSHYGTLYLLKIGFSQITLANLNGSK